MSDTSFEIDIKPILQNYVACMKNVVVADEEGTENLDLSNYEIVKRFHHIIQVAIHGYDEGANAAHRMPPSGPLADQDIQMFDQWITDGMLA